MTTYAAGDCSQNNPQRARKPACLTAILLAIVVSSGCMYVNRQYLTPQQPYLTCSDIPVASAPIPVNIEIEYQNPFMRDRLTEPIFRPKVVRALTASRMFVEANESNKTHVGTLHVLIRRKHEPREFARALGSTFLTGFTWGLFTSEVSDAYEMAVRYTPANGAECVAWTGTINRRQVIGVRAFRNQGGAVPRADLIDRITSDLIAGFVHDFQTNGRVRTQIAAVPVATAATAVTTSPLVVTPPPVGGGQSPSANAYPLTNVSSAESPVTASGQAPWTVSNATGTTQGESSGWLR